MYIRALAYRLLPRCFARLLFRKEGVTTLEFALITPVLLLMVMGIIEFSIIMLVMATMESATATTSRLGKTGYAPSGISRQQHIINTIQARTAGILQSNLITITTTVYPSFSNAGPEPYTDSNNNGQYTVGEPYNDINGNGSWDANLGTSGVGSAGDIVVYNVSYPWPVMTPPLRPILGNTYNITVRSIVKNEPFN